MSIKITFTEDSPLQVFAVLTAMGMHCQCNEAVYTAARQILETETLPARFRAAAPEGQTQTPAAPAQMAAPAPPAAIPAAPAPVPAPVPVAAPAASAPAPAAPAPVPVPAPAPAVPVAAVPTYTTEQLGRAGAELVAAQPGRMPEFLAMLGRYGVQAVTELRPDQLGAFATELRGMGAKL